MDYKESGVDTEAHQSALSSLKDKIRSSFGNQVVGDVGHFGGLYALPGDEDRVLVATTDGLGTKVELLASLGLHERVGQDLVNHCINDIAVLGARPLFFLDYIAGAGLIPEILRPLVDGFVEGCLHHGIPLLGGETAEMPGVYREGGYDVAGFLVGEVQRDRIVDGSIIEPGDTVIGFPSAGLHTNGYSLARRVLLGSGEKGLHETPPGWSRTVGQALAAPHLSYRSALEALTSAGLLKGAAHITGGGLVENIPRILPGGTGVVIDRTRWKVPPIFDLIEVRGDIEQHEMFRVFNMGIGVTALVSGNRTDEAFALLTESEFTPISIGQVVEGEGRVELGW